MGVQISPAGLVLRSINSHTLPSIRISLVNSSIR